MSSLKWMNKNKLLSIQTTDVFILCKNEFYAELLQRESLGSLLLNPVRHFGKMKSGRFFLLDNKLISSPIAILPKKWRTNDYKRACRMLT